MFILSKFQTTDEKHEQGADKRQKLSASDSNIEVVQYIIIYMLFPHGEPLVERHAKRT